MYFEDIATRDLPQLPLDHKFHWLEDKLKRDILPKKDIHDKEHEDQLIHWGCNPEHTSKLTIRKDESGQAFADRMYHIALHLRYWKEKGQHTDIVQRFEEESGYNLDNLTIPKPSDTGESVY